MHYSDLVAVFERMDSTSKRLEKTRHLAGFLQEVPKAKLRTAMQLIEGQPYPDWDPRKIGVASQIIIKAIGQAAGMPEAKVLAEFKKSGDLGLVAQRLVGSKRQSTLGSTEITAEKVLKNIQSLAAMEGSGSVDRKIGLIIELLSSATPLEARYLTRTILGQLRVGSGAGTIRDAIAWAFFPQIEGVTFLDKTGKEFQAETMPPLATVHNYDRIIAREELAREIYNAILAKVQGAYDVTNDWGKVALAAKDGVPALERIELTIGVPIKVMLAIKVDSIAEAFEIAGSPLAAEYKYDGFRLQVHKAGDKITLFTRRLEDVSAQFPDVRKAFGAVKAEGYILDCEAVGIDPKTKKYLTFQQISQRIRRKYGIEEMVKHFPVEVNVFDIMALDGKSLLHEPYERRYALVQRIVPRKESVLMPATHILAQTPADVQRLYEASLKVGNEGLMLKRLDAPYQPGARVGHMLKLKAVMETLDCVIVGAQWGEGKRSAWLASFVIGVRAGQEFVEIGRVGTGFKEKEDEGVSFAQLTELLKPLIISEEGTIVKVKPKVVIEVTFEEIQQSPSYGSGFALRFPRLFRLRDDKGPDDASTLADVKRLYNSQKKVHN